MSIEEAILISPILAKHYILWLNIIYFPGRINIITGPNYSGKSIYIKQVELSLSLSLTSHNVNLVLWNVCVPKTE